MKKQEVKYEENVYVEVCTTEGIRTFGREASFTHAIDVLKDRGLLMGTPTTFEVWEKGGAWRTVEWLPVKDSPMVNVLKGSDHRRLRAWGDSEKRMMGASGVAAWIKRLKKPRDVLEEKRQKTLSSMAPGDRRRMTTAMTSFLRAIPIQVYTRWDFVRLFSKSEEMKSLRDPLDMDFLALVIMYVHYSFEVLTRHPVVRGECTKGVEDERVRWRGEASMLKT